MLGIVNVVGSSIARETDNVFCTLAGTEISVATTKAIEGYLLALQFAKARGEITEDKYSELLAEVNTILEKVEKIFEDKEWFQWYSNKLIKISNALFIGRGIDYVIGMEGSQLYSLRSICCRRD